jgi:hypothetical protein
VQIWTIAIVVTVCGAIGGFVNAAGAILTGIGGARILSNEIEKKAMARTKKNLTEFTDSGEKKHGD